MKTGLSMKQNLSSVFCPVVKQNYFMKAILVFVGSLLIAAAAQITIPIEPVPVTLQSFAVLFIGMIYGSRLGLYTVLLYLFEGAIGIPIYANFHGGIYWLLSPTGGYLLGFAPAAWLSGYLIETGWGKNIVGILIAGILALAVIYACGLAMLSAYVGWSNAINLGLKPFLVFALIKLAILAITVPRFWKTS